MQHPEGPAPRVPRVTEAVLLAGGRGSRLGGVEKAELQVAGRPLVAQWCAALAERGITVAVVGPSRLAPLLPRGTMLTREEPRFSGPASALYAGWNALEAGHGETAPLRAEGVRGGEYFAVLAVDIVEPAALLDWLFAQLHLNGAADALIPVDRGGKDQLTCSLHALGPLRSRMAGVGPDDVVGSSLRRLLLAEDRPSGNRADLTVARSVLPDQLGADVDTPDDAQRLGVRAPRSSPDPALDPGLSPARSPETGPEPNPRG